MKWLAVNWPKENYQKNIIQTKVTNSMIKLKAVGTPGEIVINENTIRSYGLIEPVWVKDGDIWITTAKDTEAVLHFYVHISGKTYWTLGVSQQAYAFIKGLYEEAI